MEACVDLLLVGDDTFLRAHDQWFEYFYRDMGRLGPSLANTLYRGAINLTYNLRSGLFLGISQ